ncbi:MAG: hypothetical protein P8X74_22870, partial [Reinekea sp.]
MSDIINVAVAKAKKTLPQVPINLKNINSRASPDTSLIAIFSASATSRILSKYGRLRCLGNGPRSVMELTRSGCQCGA